MLIMFPLVQKSSLIVRKLVHTWLLLISSRPAVTCGHMSDAGGIQLNISTFFTLDLH